MKLPNAQNAEIASSKLLNYLLSAEHPVGKWKARVFRSCGFNSSNLALLREGLLSIARLEDVQDIIQGPHGTKYIIDGSLLGPKGDTLKVRSIWIIERDDRIPRFVTAYPR
jgi:hypothetical protein